MEGSAVNHLFSQDTVFGSEVFKFIVADESIILNIRHLLRAHLLAKQESNNNPNIVTIELVIEDYGEKKRPVCLQEPTLARNEWIWGIPKDAPMWIAERLYYRVIFTVLAKAFAGVKLARVHGALLYISSIGSVLVLGDRGAGKSTVASSWLLGGGSVCTDDMTILKENAGELQCFGIHREFHIDPALQTRLVGLKALCSYEEYLPGAGRLAYDWITHFPNQCITAVPRPDHIILSQVESKRLTTIQALGLTEKNSLIDHIIASEADNDALDESLRDFISKKLNEAQGWSISWGYDIWNYKEKHIGFLHDHLNT